MAKDSEIIDVIDAADGDLLVIDAPTDDTSDVPTDDAPNDDAPGSDDVPADDAPNDDAPGSDDEKSDEKSDGASDVPAVAKLSATEKRANVVTAFGTRNVPETVSAMVAFGKGATDLFGTLVASALVACQTDPTDPGTWDMDGMRDVSTFKVAVETAYASIDQKSAREHSDPTTGAVMAFIRAIINREKANRNVTDTTSAAEKVGVSADSLSARAIAFFSSNGCTIDALDDIALADTDALDKVYGSARGGRRVSATSDTARVPAPTTPRNGADGWATGKNADHIAHVVNANGGATTLKVINKAVSPSYPGTRSTGAIRNAFMRGVKGYTMSRGADGAWNVTRDAVDVPAVPETSDAVA